MNLNKISKFLRSTDRVVRDLNAVSRGPKAVAKRMARKAIGKHIGKFFNWK